MYFQLQNVSKIPETQNNGQFGNLITAALLILHADERWREREEE